MDWESLVACLWERVEAQGISSLKRLLVNARARDELDALLDVLGLLQAAARADAARSLLLETLRNHANAERLRLRLQIVLLFDARRTPPPDVEALLSLDKLIEKTSLLIQTGNSLQALELAVAADVLVETPEYFELLGRLLLLQRQAAEADKAAEPVGLQADPAMQLTPHVEDGEQDAPDIGLMIVELPEQILAPTDPSIRENAIQRNTALTTALHEAVSTDEELIWLELPDEDDVPEQPAVTVQDAAAKTSVEMPPAMPDPLPAECLRHLSPNCQRVLLFFVEHPGSTVAAASQTLALPPVRLHSLLAGGLRGLLVAQAGCIRPVENLQAAIAAQKATQPGRSSPAPIPAPSPAPAPRKALPGQRPVSARDVNMARRLSKLSPRGAELIRLLHERPSYVRDLAQRLTVDPSHINALLLRDLSDFVHVKGGQWSLDESAIFPAQLARILPEQ